MSRPVALLDSGLRRGSENSAIDRDWLARHAAGERPGLLRFYRSLPTASIGRHQAIDRELRLDYCRRRGIEPVRRPSGGGALYLDERQLGFSLILKRPAAWQQTGLAHILEQFCTALAAGLARLGIRAGFKFPNDLEIEGRKIASAFAAGEGDSLLLHGTLLLDADIRTMLEALRVPTEKLSPDGLAAARDRLVTVAECCPQAPPLDQIRQAIADGLSEALGLQLREAEEEALKDLLSGTAAAEEAIAHEIDWSGDAHQSLESLWKAPGGVLRARVEFTADARRLKQVEFAGDAHIHPADLLTRLALALRGQQVEHVRYEAGRFLREHPADAAGVGMHDILQLLDLALDKLAARQAMDLTAVQANSLMVYNPTAAATPDILRQASVMLVPYCAKPAWCKWRHQDGCAECGLCEVGDAYRLARERQMQVTTVTQYEHLVATLAEMKEKGTQAYVGMCCSNFFIKRHRAFQEAGMPAVLMDISGANCYELKQESQAYAGTFQAEAKLDAEMLYQVIKLVPKAETPAESPDASGDPQGQPMQGMI
jgi:lipoate-protein ligase A